MKNFNNKVAVITGAASGIGLGIAQWCAQEKMRLVLADSEEQKLKQLETKIKAINPNVIAVTTDVSKAEQVENLAKIAVKTYGQINLLVNSAGVCGPFGAIWEIPMNQLQWTLEVNLMGTIHTLRTMIPIMLEQRDEGHIVNISSHVGLVSNPHLTAYQITKHAIVTLSESLRNDLVIQNSNIGVSVFFPYFVQSDLANSGRHLKNNKLYVANQAQELLDTLNELTDKGISPSDAARILFDGIKENKFYIFTDETTKTSFQERVEKMLA